MKRALASFIEGLPKAELHLHIEGTLEPEMMFRLAARNNIEIPYGSVDEVQAAYNFRNLQDFLDLYYQGTAVLVTEQDFYELTSAYLAKVHGQNVSHVEIFFDPQAHSRRGVPIEAVIDGIWRALREAQNRFGISSRLIMCFLRDLPPEQAMETLEQALPYKDRIIAVGLDSAELGNPPGKFRGVFERAREEGFLTVAHAGEEGPAAYIQDALNLLRVERIDHGVRVLEDEALVERLVSEKTPFTVCPLSNARLQVVPDIERHPLRCMMEKGLMVTVNSDDPAYFGGYINENYEAVSTALGLTHGDLCCLARNSFEAAFLPRAKKLELITRLDEFANANV